MIYNGWPIRDDLDDSQKLQCQNYEIKGMHLYSTMTNSSVNLMPSLIHHSTCSQGLSQVFNLINMFKLKMNGLTFNLSSLQESDSQSGFLHGLSGLDSARMTTALSEGSSLMPHSRLRSREPPPHVTEQGDHGVQGPISETLFHTMCRPSFMDIKQKLIETPGLGLGLIVHFGLCGTFLTYQRGPGYH